MSEWDAPAPVRFDDEFGVSTGNDFGGGGADRFGNDGDVPVGEGGAGEGGGGGDSNCRK